MSSLSPNRSFAAIVLAAGKSTRMKSKVPKALHPIAGKPLIMHALDALKLAGATKIVVVVGYQADLVKAALGASYEYVEQVEQLGTGHAAQMAAPILGDWDGPVVIIPGDAPMISADAIGSLIDSHADGAATLLTVHLAKPKGYGRILRSESGAVLGIVEEKDATDEQRAITEVGVSVYAFQASFLFDALAKVKPSNAQGEYYLTDTIALANEAGHSVNAFTWHDPQVGLGINDRQQLSEVAELMKTSIHRKHMANGVTIVDPATTFIDAAVRIGQDTVIRPFTILSGVTDIGEDCTIGPGARVTDSQIGNGVSIKDSHVTSSEVGDGTTIGPFANLRPGSLIGKKVKIGDFVETKQTTLEDGVSAGHFAYLGNAHVGEGTNIGAGTITCNYDGKNKHKTTIGKKSFVGSNTTLVAPVSIGEGAYVAAGSTITDDVPADALAFGRSRQVTKADWAKRRRERGE
ncbi:MAG TPA: bifunctional UDP-N-acetylglucosamine diphosphorylase/glucosamine-1-phosphate N-acetyltransferase GlmU [Capsulimonadaceae bacterium]|jgi:bifunctional UDP-N-acetylglucosamine pyrophosphorylase/glucosamine-1-phosphate N-acetyltransferase